MNGCYSVNDIEGIRQDLKNDIEACVRIGLAELACTLSNALNLVDWLLESNKQRLIKEVKEKTRAEIKAKVEIRSEE